MIVDKTESLSFANIEKFLSKKKLRGKIKELADHYPEKKSLLVDYEELHKFDPNLAEELVANPDGAIKIFNEALISLSKPIFVGDVETKEPHLHTRFFNLPQERGYKVLVKNITSDYINKLISVDGLVNKTSNVLPKVSVGRFICNKCSEEHNEPQPTRFLREPIMCKNCHRRDFRFDPENSQWTDIQRMEIQEPLELLKGGEEARRIEIWLEDDLTDLAIPGDKISITGVVRLMPPKKRGSVYQRFIEANWIEKATSEFEEIEITPEEEKEIKKISKDPLIYNKIVSSIAPSIYGYKEVKEAVALQMFGSRYGKKMPEGTPVRGDIHVLLIGDPGVAKSRVLQYVDEIAPKSLYVTGKGATGAGLTATAEKDEFAEGAWTLKAGALVLAGGGICAIDEFDKMREEDRSAIHEAMEQQTISIAKAGIVTRFKANTAVLAAANPKFSRFDNYKPLGEQFNIPPTLLSRFDLIFPLQDVLDPEKDRKIAEHMLKIHRGEKEMEELQPEIPPTLFQKYVAYARKNISPILSSDAADKIRDYYVELRGKGGEGRISATPRQLEALVRLSEASAKVRLSNVATISDAERAINLTNFVLREIATDESGKLDIDRITTEHPKSTRDKIRIIEEVINNLVKESGDGTSSWDDIIAEAQAKGVDKFKAEQFITELKRKGIIFEPRHGKFMLTEG